MTERGPMSEQQEELEPRWGTREGHSVRRDPETAGPQFTSADDDADTDGDFVDEEPTAIADQAGSNYPVGPEDAAMHIENEEGRPSE
jgi:hypothetical protein